MNSDAKEKTATDFQQTAVKAQAAGDHQAALASFTAALPFDDFTLLIARRLPQSKKSA